MSDINMTILVLCIYGIIGIITILIWIFASPEDDLCDICLFGLFWPLALLLLIIFTPFKLLEILQNKVIEHRSKKKYYDTDGYRYEDEDWYSEG